jgi:hypothetical protein
LRADPCSQPKLAMPLHPIWIAQQPYVSVPTCLLAMKRF